MSNKHLSIAPRSILAFTIIALSLSGCSHRRLRQPPTEKVALATPPPTAVEINRAWNRASALAPQHDLLKELSGRHKAVVKFWGSPTALPEVTRATSVHTLIMGGRFLREDFYGKAGKISFTGQGITGYDTVSERYVSSWIDSLSTAISTSWGRYDPKARTITWHGLRLDVVTKEKLPVKSVTTFIDAKHHNFEMFDLVGHGEWAKILEISYTRTK